MVRNRTRSVEAAGGRSFPATHSNGGALECHTIREIKTHTIPMQMSGRWNRICFSRGKRVTTYEYRYPKKSMPVKKSMLVAQTDEEPPNHGKSAFPKIS